MMRRALDLAREGVGLVSPNPLVGCVIVAEEGRVVGEGSYTYDGVTHAEAAALEQAGHRARGGTAYVSLEPHAHHGRTPPCTDLLLAAGIKRVVAPIEDPNPLVSGKGFAELRDHGIEVDVGVLAEEAARLNEKFTVWHREGRPFVHLKLAISLDGRISLNRSTSTAISSHAAGGRVHEIRHEHDAILVGGNTAVVDDPSLTDRSGNARRRKLVRVVLDNRLAILPGSKLAQTARNVPTVVISSSSDDAKRSELESLGVEVIRDDARDLSAVLQHLRQKDLQSVLVEGGSEVAGAFLDACLVDKFTFIYAPIVIGGHEAPVAIGGKGPATISEAIHIRDIQVVYLGDDVEATGYPEFAK